MAVLDLNFKLLRLSVYALLDDPRGWSIQGFGMLRKYLTPDVRLHVWSPAHAVPGVTTIHDHPWSFTSVIVAGEITDKTYERNFNPELPKTHHQHKITCGVGGHVRPETYPDVCLRIEKRRVFGPGESYQHFSEDLHETVAVNGSVTIISRVPSRYDATEANVCVPLGQSFVSAEPREATPEEVEQITQDAKTRIEIEARFGTTGGI